MVRRTHRGQKQSTLTYRFRLYAFLAACDRLIDCSEKSPARRAQASQRPRFYKAFQHPLVQTSRLDGLAKSEKTLKSNSAFLSFANRFCGVLANVLDCCKSKPDVVAHGREV